MVAYRPLPNESIASTSSFKFDKLIPIHNKFTKKETFGKGPNPVYDRLLQSYNRLCKSKLGKFHINMNHN